VEQQRLDSARLPSSARARVDSCNKTPKMPNQALIFDVRRIFKS